MFLASVISEMPGVFHVAELLYVCVFSAEVIRYIRGKKEHWYRLGICGEIRSVIREIIYANIIKHCSAIPSNYNEFSNFHGMILKNISHRRVCRMKLSSRY